MSTAGHIATTHAGSLPRSVELSDALARERREGVHRSSVVRDLAASEIRRIVALQVEAGVDIVGDGEQGRVGFQIYIPQRMVGFGGRSERTIPADLAELTASQHTLTGEAAVDPPAAVDEVRYEGELEASEDCELLIGALADAGLGASSGFVTAPSPGIVATTFRNRHYESYERYLFALAGELRREYEVIVGSGLQLQIDAPDLAMERHQYFSRESLSGFLSMLELHIEALNAAIAGFPADRVRLHCCWGNYEAPHADDVELEQILPIISRAQVGALGVALANPRHEHEVEVIAKHGLPDGMKLVAGVIDTTTNYLEHPGVVAMRLKAAVRAMGDPSRVLASPDCGFGTMVGYEPVMPTVVWAKLASLREGADLAVATL
jgi:5-methyltetrahydropteroyltriglutamate--homocysteine methyltransferase